VSHEAPARGVPASFDHAPRGDDVQAIDRDGGTGAPPPLITRAFRAAPARPNPFRVTATVPVFLAGAASVTLSVFDAAGRRQLHRRSDLPAGEQFVVWDGTGSGNPLPAGVYFVRISSTLGSTTQRVVLLR
jgi:hypothetical protein